MNAMHEWLRQTNGMKANASWDELSRLRRLGIAFADLPATWGEFLDGLNDLARSGLAERSKDLWLWLPARKVEAVRQKAQASLF